MKQKPVNIDRLFFILQNHHYLIIIFLTKKYDLYQRIDRNMLYFCKLKLNL